jgi:protein TonB
MKFLGALSVSLALHLILVQWRWTPVLEEPSSGGRAALAIQQMHFVEAKVETKKEPQPTEIQPAVVPREKQIREIELQSHKKTPLKEHSLLAESAPLADLNDSSSISEEKTEKRVTPQKGEPVSPDIQDELNEGMDIQHKVVSTKMNEPLLDKVDKHELSEVVSTVEEQSTHTGFDRLPTMGKPRYRKAFPPPYPRLAMRKGQQGMVMVKAKVGVDGDVETVELLESSGHQLLDECALNTVKQWQFYPYQVDHKNTVAWVNVPVEFALGH